MEITDMHEGVIGSNPSREAEGMAKIEGAHATEGHQSTARTYDLPLISPTPSEGPSVIGNTSTVLAARVRGLRGPPQALSILT